MNIAAGIETESYWTEAPKLRFVERNGSRVLQYLEVRRFEYKVEYVWLDVTLVPVGDGR